MRRIAAASISIALSFAGSAWASVPQANGARMPADVVRSVVGAYARCAIAELDAVLSADFRFDFTAYGPHGPTWALPMSVGDRAMELRLARKLMGITSYYRSRRMEAYGAFVSCGSVEEGTDPEHADSTRQYRLLVVRDFRIHFVRPRPYGSPDGVDEGVMDYLKGLQVLHVVRGDAAVRVPGQPADSMHWYARRWIQDVDELTLELGKLDGECGGDLSAGEPRGIAAPIVALRAINAPLCPTLKVICDLPGPEPAQLEVYDVQGRRMAQRTVLPSAPGSVLVEAGNGMRFTPGVYWVRLQQGSRPAAVKRVLVAL